MASPDRIRSKIEGARAEDFNQKVTELKEYVTNNSVSADQVSGGNNRAFAHFVLLPQAPKIDLNASAESIAQQFQDLQTFAATMNNVGVYVGAFFALKTILQSGAEDTVEQFKAKFEQLTNQTPFEITAEDEYQVTLAAYCRTKKLAELLVSYEAFKASFADPAQKTKHVRSFLNLLSWNSGCDRAELIGAAQVFIDAGHPIHDPDLRWGGSDQSSLMIAASMDIEMLKVVLAVFPKEYINTENMYQRTAMNEAVARRDPDSVKLLIDAGAKYNLAVYQTVLQSYDLTFVEMLFALPGAKEQVEASQLYEIAKYNRYTGLIPAIASAGFPATADVIWYAAQTGVTEFVQECIAAGAPLTLCADRDRAPLHCANNEDSARALLAAGANPNELTSDGSTPLMCALTSCLFSVADALLPVTDLSLKRADGKTHVRIAIMYCSGYEIAQRLIAAGAACDYVDEDGVTDFLAALQYNNVALAAAIAEKITVDLNYVTKNGDDALFLAVQAGCDRTQPLIQKIFETCDVKRVRERDGMTLMHLVASARYGTTDNALLVKDFIARGADMLALYQNAPITRSIVNNWRSDSDARDAIWNAWLEQAKAAGKVIEQLQIMDETSDRHTTLTYVAYAGSSVDDEYNRLLALFFAAGVDVNIRHPADNRTMLMAASWGNNPGGVQTLLNAGADVTLLDNRGCSALDYCRVGVDMAKLLYAGGARLNVTGALTFGSWGSDMLTEFKDEVARYPPNSDLAWDILENHSDQSDRLIAMLEAKEIDVNVPTASKQTLLCRAAYAGNYDEDAWFHWMKRFIAAGADINLAQPVDGATPLGEAVRGRNAGAMTVLLGCENVNLNGRGLGGKTPLYIAVENTNTEYITRLVQRGADVNATNEDGLTPKDATTDESILALLGTTPTPAAATE